MNNNKAKENSMQKGEISGAFLLGLVYAFADNNLIPQDDFPFNPNEILPQEWYPFDYFFKTLEVVEKEISHADNIMFWAGVNFLNIWYYHGPGKELISSGLDWIYANNESGGYNSVARSGSPDEIGWCRITDIDVEKGYVVYENFNPFQSEFLRGLFYAGCILFDDMEYVTVETIANPHKNKGRIVYTTITINFRLKKNKELDAKINDLNLKTPTINLSKAESQSLAWEVKGLQYHNQLLKSHQEELSTVLGENLSHLRKTTKKLQDYISLVEEMSITDALTGIYNRRYFDEHLPKVINSAKRKNELVNFIMMDIDHFKQYNDTYGHQMGDDVLVKIAKTLKDSLHRADDYCFRLGGEEFGVIFKANTKEESIKFANTLKQNIENLHITHSGNSASPYVTASFGLICQKANDILNTNEIYKQADDLLYTSKNLGRNRVSY
jgi:diguanylate cyclase (GGDEF)-like protein